MRFARARRHDSHIDAWLQRQSPELRALADTWFTRLRHCGADVCELMHDGAATACVGDAAFGYVSAYRDHVNVGFFFGALLADPAHLLVGTGKRMRHVKLRHGVPVPDGALGALIAQAYADIRARQRRATSGA